MIPLAFGRDICSLGILKRVLMLACADDLLAGMHSDSGWLSTAVGAVKCKCNVCLKYCTSET